MLAGFLGVAAIVVLIMRLSNASRINQLPQGTKPEGEVPYRYITAVPTIPAGTKIAQSDNAQVYMTSIIENSKPLLVFTHYNPSSGRTTTLPDKYSLRLFTQAYVSPVGDYVAVTVSSSSRRDIPVKRSVNVYSVDPLQEVARGLCMVSMPRFWRNYLIFDTCDRETQVAAIDLNSDSYKVVALGTVKMVMADNLTTQSQGQEKTLKLASILMY